MGNLIQLALSQQDVEKIIKLLNSLFGKSKVRSRSQKNLSITYPDRFYLYFAYYFLEDKLSEVEFEKACLGSVDDFKIKIDNWLDKGLYFYLERRFIQIETFNGREEFEKIVSVIFYLSRQMQNGKQYGFDTTNLSSKLSDYKSLITNKFYPTKESYVQFVRVLFSTAVYPYTFEASLINRLNTSYAFYNKDAFPLIMEERINILLDYFERYVGSISVWDDFAWDLYHCCKYKEWEKKSENSFSSKEHIPEKCKEILITLIDKDLNYYLNIMIDFPPFNHDEVMVSRYVLDTFNTWDQFEAYLLDKDEDQFSYLGEFKIFYNLFKQSGFQKVLGFEFNIIPAYDKLNGRTIETFV